MVEKHRKQIEPAPTEAANTGAVKTWTRPPTGQAWFWTPAWQAKECEAHDEVAAGRVRRFMSDEEFLASLEEEEHLLALFGPPGPRYGRPGLMMGSRHAEVVREYSSSHYLLALRLPKLAATWLRSRRLGAARFTLGPRRPLFYRFLQSRMISSISCNDNPALRC